MEMKKILGILLAVCFLMSVTVAAVSAGTVEKVGYKNGKDKRMDEEHNKKNEEKNKRMKEDERKRKEESDRKKRDEDRKWKENNDRKKREEQKRHNEKKRHFHRGHFEYKKVGHKEFRNYNGHRKVVVIYKVIKVYKAGYWDFN